ncbi:MAG TPA: DUF2970 domain-containing protein [Fontimonas sp.]
MRQDQQQEAETGSAPTPWQVAASVAWSFFGVQSSRNRRRDFTYGKPGPFILAALLMTAAVVLLFAGAAQLALHLALPA